VTSQPRQLAALGLAVVLIVGVLIVIATSVANNVAPQAVQLHGLIGSEKLPFFQDQHVIDALKKGGFDVSVNTAGSRQIASADLSHEDFAFPAGAPSAQKIHADHPGSVSIVPFFTPMAIASWKPIADLLQTAGVVHQRNGYLAVDVAAYMALVAKDTRWNDLPGNTTYPINRSILVTTTDVRSSNSAAMYLGLVSYVANGNNIVENNSSLDSIVNVAAPLFLRQGFVENSSEAPFEDYLVQGMGKSPMVMIYEAQYLARAAAKDGSITPDMVLMYPEPTIFSKHTFVGLTPDGIRLGSFLANDPTIRQLATQYGFRTADTAAFKQFVTSNNLTVPDQIIDVIEPPTYETLEAMITRLSALYAGSTPAPSGTDDEGISPSPSASQ
jgi:hypothetical protein